MSGVAHTVSVLRGNIYLSHETCETYFPDVQCVALVQRDDAVAIMPLIRESGGGLLLKVRNSLGDRVIHAQEFFRDKGLLEDFEERRLPVRWSSELAALMLANLPKVGD
jgi:hypothetical protein